MVQYIDKDALVAEIDRLKSQLLRGACSSQIAMETRCKEEAYDEVLTLLDSMQEEPVSEDLEFASEKYACRFSSSKYGHDKVKDAFIAGADWQKEQMMSKAIDVEVKVDAGGYPYIDKTIELYDYCEDVPLAKEGEKYKIVLIKE